MYFVVPYIMTVAGLRTPDATRRRSGGGGGGASACDRGRAGRGFARQINSDDDAPAHTLLRPSRPLRALTRDGG